MHAEIPGMKKAGLQALPQISDRMSFLYLEHCVISRQDGAVTVTDARGTVHVPAASLGVLGLAGFAGQFFFGWLSDRLRDPKYASFLGMSFMLAGLVALLQVDSARGLFFYAVIFGFGYGALAPMMPILLADRFGRDTLGSIYGFVTLFLGIGGGIGPFLAGMIYDAFGSYAFVWQAEILVMIFVAGCILTLKRKDAGPC